MINYIEKGIGLHEALVKSGHNLTQIDGVWVSSDDVLVQAFIDNYPLAATQAEMRSNISTHARELRDAVVAAISPAEMASWSIKRAEALAYSISGNPADAPMLTVEAGARGITLADIVQRVQYNASALATLEAKIGGTEGKHRDAIAALDTFEAVLAYDYSTGWPI